MEVTGREASRVTPRLPGCTAEWTGVPFTGQVTHKRIGLSGGLRKRVGPRGMAFIPDKWNLRYFKISKRRF